MLHLETELLNPEPFDFVIADTFHSASGGFEIAQRLPSLSPRPPKVVLLLSAARREDVPAALPVFAQLIKPARARKLRLALENTLNPQPVSAPTPASPAPSEVPHGRRLRVLVAEDNATNQRIVRTHLEAWGHIVVGAGDGSEAIERLAREPFDLIFMDLQMPKMDGVTATLAIRKKETGDARIPIVALTANVLKGVREECLAAGMDGYLGKPVREHELLSTIESVIPGLRPVAHTQVTPSAPVPASSSDSEFPFDAAELLASVNGNRDTIAGLLRDSRDEDLPGLVATLTDALAAGNCDQIRRAAHAVHALRAARVHSQARADEQWARHLCCGEGARHLCCGEKHPSTALRYFFAEGERVGLLDAQDGGLELTPPIREEGGRVELAIRDRIEPCLESRCERSVHILLEARRGRREQRRHELSVVVRPEGAPDHSHIPALLQRLENARVRRRAPNAQRL